MVHLTRCHSYYCPILLEMQPKINMGRKRPFRFQTCWLSKPSFPSIVSRAWSGSPALGEVVNKFTQVALRWNVSHFSNIFSRKKNIMARINGIQWALSVRPSAFLVNLENELLKELDQVLNQEEELWALKSRVNWMIQGDCNTTFYHVSTLVCRKRNQILTIKDPMGEWVHEESAIKEVVRSGFNAIYTTSFVAGSRGDPSLSQWQARLTNKEKESIGRVASEEEIKFALWSLKVFKAPRLDGLHAGFLHRFC